MERQEHYREEYRRRKPGWRDSLALYREQVDEAVEAESWVLDLGCGHADLLAPVLAKTPHTVGIDPDQRALAKNRVVRHRVRGAGERLPFRDGSFDAVAAAWVVEHLTDPTAVAREVHRVLRPGGRFVFLTPNALNPNVWLIRAVPNRLHDPLTRRLYGRQERDTYPVCYRLNTPRAIDGVLLPLGFTKVRLHLNGDPSYLSFDPKTFRLACALEALIERVAGGAKVHLVGVYAA